ncbi:hypothetical protein PAECIP111892_05014 [Paenibacillus auburnensis]|uniref:Uncharacterized protein n=1 Tax=Paenibacillus auburnensis TaxID=2905649 RepID=A0ABM9CTC1_9BACL|nr:hypothetical protein PAECIP111892_05014 [Paenibacillus auburnensis]
MEVPGMLLITGTFFAQVSGGIHWVFGGSRKL